MKKIGILGGTFHTIHNAHLNIAKAAMEQYDLAEVWFMPAGIPPHKKIADIVTPKQRLEMVKLAVSDCEQFQVCDIEIEAKEPCYTYKTLHRLKEEYKDSCEFYFIIGGDSFYDFTKWVRPEEIVSYADILVARRPGLDIEDDQLFEKTLLQYEAHFGPCFHEVKAKEMAISSTEIRHRLSTREDVSSLIPEKVMQYISYHGLYTKSLDLEEIQKLQKEVKKELKSDRYRHTIGVMQTAANLAFRWAYTYEDAMVAGLLHDCAKCISDEERLSIAKKADIFVSDIEKKHPHLLHGKVGAYFAKEKYHINDERICHAIAVHTTGCPEMSLLDEIIFVADYIEPRRDKAPRLAEIRQMAYIDLSMCVYMILEDTMAYLQQHPESLDTTTQACYEYYKEKIKNG